jgi:hypothetical protein
MKSIIYSSFILLFSLSLNAQVGIGTTDPEAALDIRSSDQTAPTNQDGILIPKVDDFPTVNPTASQDGMLVFVTGNGTPIKGFYYWDATAVAWLSFGGATGWLTTGNPDIVDGTNFIGTITNIDVAFRRNNAPAGRLSTNNTAFGVGSLLTNSANAWNTAIGTDALGSVTNGSRNVAIGHKALESATTQRFNVAIGYTALQDNRGEWNTAIGHEALKDISDGAAQYNVAIGHQAMDLATGVSNFNVAIGSGALRSANGGTQNTVIGSNAGTNITSGDTNIVIGNGAQVPSATASNQISIGNLIYGSLGNIGIGVAVPTAKLEVDGKIRAVDVNFSGLPVFADENAAILGGIATGDLYQTSTGEIRIKL